jgi:DNA polymerase
MSEPRTIVIDFETFYDKKAHYSMRDMSTPEFIHDKRFKVFGLAVDDGKAQRFIPANLIPAFLKTIQHDIIVMHNAFFDAGVLYWRYGFRPAWMIDTLLLANHVFGSSRDGGSDGNDLDTLARRLGLPETKGELSFMDGVSNPTNGQLVDLGEYAMKDARLTRQVLDKLMPQVSNPEFELWLLDHTLRIYTEKMLGIDTKKLAETKLKVKLRREELVKASDVSADVLNSNKQFAEELTRRLKAAKLKVPMKRAKARKDGSTPLIPALAKGDAAFIALADSSVESVSTLIKARLVERSAVTVAARLATMEKYASLGLGIPVHLVYYGAHTGRFSGGGGFNFQNLTSPARASDPIEREIAGMVRDCIIPHPTDGGMVFVPVDAAQIEARVLAWLAGEEQILEAFADGADIYSQFISEVLGKDIHKPTPAEEANAKLVAYLKIMRQVGKESVLGLGFSMGATKFFANLKNGGSVKSKDLIRFVEDGGITEQMAEDIVVFYREKYTKIVAFWAKLNSAFMAAILGATRKVGPLTFRKVGPKAVGITLPSGRTLFYRNLRQEAEKAPGGQTRKVWKHGNGQRIYGGLLAENVTQAVARDILAEAIHAAEAAGYPVVLHIHDEIVPRVPQVQGQAALDFLSKALSTPPEWGKGLVLGAEGHVSKTLSK